MELLWITNIPTPYTVPLWRELGQLVDLHVACMAETEGNRHWQVDLVGVQSTILGAPALKLGREGTFYGPCRGLLALFRQRPQVVVLDGWESPAFWQARVLARWFGVHVMLSYWSTGQTHRFRTGPVAAFRRRWFRTADAVITPGPATTEAVLRMGVHEDKITTGFGTVDVEHFSRSTRAARRRLGARLGHHFLYVGQLVDRKNVAALMGAFNRSRATHDTLTIVGSGPLEPALRERAERLGLDDVVDFAGQLDGDELIAAYAASHTLVLPSREEVWGLVVNEALASGLSVVVSDQCGVAGTVRSMPGVVVTDPSEVELAGALTQARSEARPSTQHEIHKMTPLASAHRLVNALPRQHTRKGLLIE